VIVEPVFGILKQVDGFRRWTVRGLENVRTHWALVCIAYNLKKLWKAARRSPTPSTSRPNIGKPTPGHNQTPHPPPLLLRLSSGTASWGQKSGSCWSSSER
jgi:hypothetical protein